MLNITICPLYIINAKISPVFTNMWREDVCPMGPLESPWSPMPVWKMTKPVRIWGQRDSMWLSNHENRSSSLQYMSQTNLVMTTSSKGKIFRVTGPLWRDSSHKGQWHGALMFSLICAWTNGWANNQDPGDLRRHRAHYDVTATSHMVSVIHPDDSHPFCTISIAPSPPDMKLL